MAKNNECAALIASYEPYSIEQLKDATPVVNRFKNAFHKWYKYRKTVAANITDKKFKEAYNAITYSYARIHLLHLKNRYSDIGMMGGSMLELCLSEDCTNKELLEFNYEKKSKELFGDN